MGRTTRQHTYENGPARGPEHSGEEHGGEEHSGEHGGEEHSGEHGAEPVAGPGMTPGGTPARTPSRTSAHAHTSTRTRGPALAAAVALLSAAVALLAAPAAAASPAPTPAAPAPCKADTGPYQWEMEEYLKLPVDGRQSAADCAAIRAFQQRQGMTPADGYASLATYRMTVVAEERRRPNRDGKCPVRTRRVVCVDLTRQLLWVQRDGRAIYQAVPVRTGRSGQETRTGWHKITDRVIDETSQLYDDAPMPYAQYFSGGQAFHGVLEDLFDGAGSAGCVNMQLADAKRFWNTTALGDTVVVWGRKPAY